MRDSLRPFLCLIVCALLVIQGAAGAAMTSCQHQAPRDHLAGDAEACPGHAVAMAADEGYGPAAVVADGVVVHAVDAVAGCDCGLCLMFSHAAVADFRLHSPRGLGTVLHAPFLPVPGSNPAFPRLKPPRHPA